MTPARVQRKRTRGWRMPDGVVYVGRPTKWGNPYRVTLYRFAHADGSPAPFDPKAAVEMARRDYLHALGVGLLGVTEEDIRRELRGKTLACWCPLDAPWCHADELLRIANGRGA